MRAGTLTLPTGAGDRVEHRAPLGEASCRDDAVPASLFDLARAWVRDHDLHPVAALQTSRRSTGCSMTTAEVLAEAADDVVTAQSLPRQRIGRRGHRRLWQRWRQRRDHQFVA